MTAANKIEGATFYGLRDLESDDILFAWKTPKSEAGGCYAYELHRQVGARLIWKPKKHHDAAATDRLREAWRREFEKPWPQLPPDLKASWKAQYVTTHTLPWSKASGPNCDVAPDMPGELRVMKFDFDLSDAELVKRFKATLPALRDGHAPERRKTETPKEMLSAITAQRLFDNRGDEPVMNFVEAHTDRFTSELRFHEASRRYTRVEETLKIRFRLDGRFRLALDPRAYRVGPRQTS